MVRCSDFLKERPYVDIIVHKDKIVFSNLLKAIIYGKDFSTVNGITTHTFSTPLESRIKDFPSMPSPYLDGLFDELDSIKQILIIKVR